MLRIFLKWLAAWGPVIGKMAQAALDGFDNYQRLNNQDQNQDQNLIEN